MSKVTSKLQITVPKSVAIQLGIRPGDEIDWVPSGEGVRLIPSARSTSPRDLAERLRLFDAASARLASRKRPARAEPTPRKRGWTREELYTRGRAR
jgi:AbrB family looped-hinge helix DNA binding protein